MEYVRYWLYEMKKSKTLLPIPYSDCLILPSELKHVTVHSYPDGGALRGAVKVSLSSNHDVRNATALTYLLVHHGRISTSTTKDSKDPTPLCSLGDTHSNVSEKLSLGRKELGSRSISKVGSATIQ